MFIRYKNLSGDSGVAAYDIDGDVLTVEFTTGAIYEYDAASAGPWEFREMCNLAPRGRGLNAFINSYAKHGYRRKVR